MSEEQNIHEGSSNGDSVPIEPAASTTETENIHTETKDMDIHHHPHVHHKKKWTDYLFEFLMLFLAVTAGFFVENQREHYIENHRAKQYAAFLYSDLIKDTANLNERSSFMEKGIQQLDSLIVVLKSFQNNPSFTAKVYELSAYAYSGVFFSSTTSTIEQLKNSGSLRYFRSNELIRHFSEYDTDLQRLEAVEDRNAYLNEETRRFLGQFLDVKSISRFNVNTTISSGFTLVKPQISEPLRFYKTDRQQFEQYANLCALKQLDWSTRIGLQTRVLHSARQLIIALKKEYKLG